MMMASLGMAVGFDEEDRHLYVHGSSSSPNKQHMNQCLILGVSEAGPCLAKNVSLMQASNRLLLLTCGQLVHV